MHTQLNPVGNMSLLSQMEVDQLQQSVTSDLYNLYQQNNKKMIERGVIDGTIYFKHSALKGIRQTE